MEETLNYKFISNGKYGAYLKVNNNLIEIEDPIIHLQFANK